MKYKYRLCSGLALAADYDMRMLQKMSQKGWHLAKLKSIVYCFEKGESCHYDYSVSFESRVSAPMLELYEAAGWTPIVIGCGYQIYRATHGTTPIYTDTESQVDLYESNCMLMRKSSIINGLIVFALLVAAVVTDWNFILFIAIIPWTLFIFHFLPYLGYRRTLKKLKDN